MCPCPALLEPLWWFRQQQEIVTAAIAHQFAITGELLMSPVSPVLFLWMNLGFSSYALSLLSLWPENDLAEGGCPGISLNLTLAAWRLVIMTVPLAWHSCLN